MIRSRKGGGCAGARWTPRGRWAPRGDLGGDLGAISARSRRDLGGHLQRDGHLDTLVLGPHLLRVPRDRRADAEVCVRERRVRHVDDTCELADEPICATWTASQTSRSVPRGRPVTSCDANSVATAHTLSQLLL